MWCVAWGRWPFRRSCPDLPYEALRHLLFAEAAAAFEELTLEDIGDTLARQDPGAWLNSFRKAAHREHDMPPVPDHPRRLYQHADSGDARLPERGNRGGPKQTVPHAITIMASPFDEVAALKLGQALEASLAVARS